MRAKTILIALGVTVLIAGVWFFALWRPQSGALDEAKNEKATAEQRLSTQSARLAHLKSLDPEDLARREALLAAAIPDADQLDQFIIDLSDQAEAAGVDFVSIAPQQPSGAAAPVEGGGSAAIPVALQIQASGDYFSMLAFLEQLRDADRLVTIEQFSLSPGGGEGEQTFTTSIGGRMFINPADSSQPTVADEPVSS